jgi:hypothetical protein
MSSPTNVSALQNPDLAAAYKTVFDILGRAYWEASDINSKDLIHGAQEALGEIITALDEEDLANNTAALIELTSKMKSVNVALKQIQDDISKITKNIATASSVVSVISKVLALVPA